MSEALADFVQPALKAKIIKDLNTTILFTLKLIIRKLRDVPVQGCHGVFSYLPGARYRSHLFCNCHFSEPLWVIGS